jgi:hypothetical protein
MRVPRKHLQPSLKDLYDYLDSIGGYLSSSVASGSAVALTSTTAANVTSITLTEGEWDVSGSVAFLPAASTSITALAGSSNETSATIGGAHNSFVRASAAVVPGAVGQVSPIPVHRVVVPAGSTQVMYLVARATFTVSTLGAYGIIQARRVA